MGARLNLKHQADIRAKIQASQLVRILQEHIFEGRELKKSQVSAAIALLRKTVPDLSQVEGVISNVNYNAADLSDAELAAVVAGTDRQSIGSDGTFKPEEGEGEPDPVYRVHPTPV